MIVQRLHVLLLVFASASTGTASKYDRMPGWITRDKAVHTSDNKGRMTREELATFCPGGTVSDIECRATTGKGEITACTVEGGLVCLTADHEPIPCNGYMVRLKCACEEISTRGSGHLSSTIWTTSAAPPNHTTTMKAPPTVHHGVTAAPTLCITKWSAWINRDEPSTGDGDHESMTQMELITFCPVGQVTRIDCQTTDNIPFYSSGEILSCSIRNGLECLNADNFPLQCSDYKVRYYCDCQAQTSPPTTQPTEVTVVPPIEDSCIEWDNWVNPGHVTLISGSDSEPIDKIQAASYLCTNPVKIECVRVSDELSYTKTGQNVTCNLRDGFACSNAENNPLCYNYKVRLGCLMDTPYCLWCIGGWSDWINRDKPDQADGDREMMTKEELAAFCTGGTVTDVWCETTAGVASYSTGEKTSCTIEDGLVCLTANNAPNPCSDYRVQYECTCDDSMTTDASITPTTEDAEVSTVTTTKLPPSTSTIRSTTRSTAKITTTKLPPSTSTKRPTARSTSKIATTKLPPSTSTKRPTTRPTAKITTTKLPPSTTKRPTASSTTKITTTAPPVCKEGWTDWIDRDDRPEPGWPDEIDNGDLQCMGPSQLARFCAGRCPHGNDASVVYPIYRVLLVTVIMMLVFV